MRISSVKTVQILLSDRVAFNTQSRRSHDKLHNLRQFICDFELVGELWLCVLNATLSERCAWLLPAKYCAALI